MNVPEPSGQRETTVEEMIESLNGLRDELVELSLALKDSMIYYENDESRASADLTLRIIKRIKNFSH